MKRRSIAVHAKIRRQLRENGSAAETPQSVMRLAAERCDWRNRTVAVDKYPVSTEVLRRNRHDAEKFRDTPDPSVEVNV